MATNTMLPPSPVSRVRMRSLPGRLAAIVALALLLATTPGAGWAASALPDGAQRIALQALDNGAETTLGDFQGRVVLVNFWAPWCVPCRQEFPELNALQRERGGPGFTVLGVTAEPDLKQVHQFVERLKPGFPVLLDTNARLHEAVDLAVMPTTLLLDRNGRLVGMYRGYTAEHGLAAIRADLARLGVGQ